MHKPKKNDVALHSFVFDVPIKCIDIENLRKLLPIYFVLNPATTHIYLKKKKITIVHNMINYFLLDAINVSEWLSMRERVYVRECRFSITINEMVGIFFS